MNYPAALMKDAYKVFHPLAYNPSVEQVHSNFTNRFGKYSNVPKNKEVIFVGLQYFILEVLVKQWDETFFSLPKKQAVAEYSRVVNAMLGKTIDVYHMEALHDLGYLPLCIKALPEGTLVPYGVPCLTITSTESGFGWVTNMIETVLSAEIWGMCTSATTAFAYRKRFEQEPSLKALGTIPFMGHDFSYRGMFGTQAAAMSGFSHLCSFVGSDTIPAALFAERYYKARIDKELVFASVDATEHSVMCSYGTQGELDSLLHLMTEVTPEGILSIVSDTWDFWKLVTEYLPQLKDVIMSRNGTTVIRPDSGNPVEILCGKVSDAITLQDEPEDFETWKKWVAEDIDDRFRDELQEDCTNPICEWSERFKFQDKVYMVTYEPDLNRHDKKYYYVDNFGSTVSKCNFEEIELTPEDKGLVECLWDIFGGTIQQETGLKLLDSHISAIYGDSITLARQDEIIKRLTAKGFVPSVILGIGSFTYQYVTRDTHGSAMKATDTVQDGKHVPIFKDPKTDQGKKSAKGLLMVVKQDGQLQLKQDVTTQEEQSSENELKTVFYNGVPTRLTSLSTIRERINKNFN